MQFKWNRKHTKGVRAWRHGILNAVYWCDHILVRNRSVKNCAKFFFSKKNSSSLKQRKKRKNSTELTALRLFLCIYFRSWLMSVCCYGQTENSITNCIMRSLTEHTKTNQPYARSLAQNRKSIGI
jgi:hypothetical protein